MIEKKFTSQALRRSRAVIHLIPPSALLTVMRLLPRANRDSGSDDVTQRCPAPSTNPTRWYGSPVARGDGSRVRAGVGLGVGARVRAADGRVHCANCLLSERTGIGDSDRTSNSVVCGSWTNRAIRRLLTQRPTGLDRYLSAEVEVATAPVPGLKGESGDTLPAVTAGPSYIHRGQVRIQDFCQGRAPRD